MTETFEILAISGSLRRESYNTGLLRAARRRAPDGVDLRIFDLKGIPLFDADLEAEGYPARVQELHAAVGAADALLIASPEYNWGITGVLKNAIDWASRPPGESTLSGKPAAIVGATPGPGGTRLAQLMVRNVLTALVVKILPAPGFYLGGAADKFENGELRDESTAERLDGVVSALVEWSRRFS